MRIRTFTLAMSISLSIVAAMTAQTQTLLSRLAEAERAKLTKGPEAAISIYESILRDFPNDRQSSAKALREMLKSYDYLGHEVKVREACQRLVEQYGDLPEVTPDVRTRCAPAPPRTRSGIFFAEMDPQTGVVRSPARSGTEAEAYESTPVYSPDGRLLHFRRYASSATLAAIDRNNFTANVFVRSLGDKAERTINPCGGLGMGRSFWLPDSRFLLTIASRSGVAPGAGCLARSDVETGQVVQPVSNYGDISSAWSALSRDGKTLYTVAARSTDGTNYQLVVIAIDSSTGTPIEGQGFALPFSKIDALTPNRNLPIMGLSPDGRTAALIRGAGTAEARLVRFDTDGGDRHYQELVTGEGRMGNAVWGRDGTRIFFARSFDGNVWQVMQVSASGGPPSFTGLEVTGLRYFDLNPENTEIAFDGLSSSISAPAYTPPSAVTAPAPPAVPPSANGPVRGGRGATGPRGARGNASAGYARGQVVVMDRNGNVEARLPDSVTTASVGGMGEVYRAVDTRLQRTVAIKLISDETSVENLLLSLFRDQFLKVSDDFVAARHQSLYLGFG